jgi:hypothetical protein
MALVCGYGYIHCCMEGGYVRDCRGYRGCTVGMVVESVGGECVGGRGNVVIGWGMM